MKKRLANQKDLVYACMRYPISVWHTASVQNNTPALLGVTIKLVTLQGYGPGGIPTYHKEVPSWVSKTKPSDVANAEMISYSQRVNKSFTSKRAWWISLAVALPAVLRGVTPLAVVAPNAAHARCTRSFALSAVWRHRCLSYPRMTARSIAAPAMINSG